MAAVKPGWKTLEGQAGIGGAITALIVSALVAYLGVTVEQATVIATGLVTAGFLLYKLIDARVKTKEAAAKVEVAQAVSAAASQSAPPAPPPVTPYVSSLMITPEREPIDGP